MISRSIQVLIGTAALAAAVICHNLTLKHIRGSTGMAWFEAGCSDEPGPGIMSCAKVLESPYSYFPPKHPEKPGRGPHFPVSFFGFLYYSTLFVWIVGVGRPTFSRRTVHLLPLFLVGIGLVFSIYYVYIMYRVIAQWCPWCLVTHGLNLLIAIGFIALWPRRRHRRLPDSDNEDPMEGAVGAMAVVPHPGMRLLLTTILAIFFVNYGHFFLFGWREAKKDQGHLLAELDYLRSNVGPFIAQWKLAAPCTIVRRTDDPVHLFSADPTDDSILDVIVFSDFECPGCAKFAQFFKEKVPLLFDNRLRVTFRHYPLDQSCNPRAGNLHPNACSAGYLAEGARTLGGNEAFWIAHDFLFAHQNEIKSGNMSADRLASGIGLDPKALANTDQSGVASRVAEDIDQGRACSIPGTPSVFVEGKRIERQVAANPEFWDKLADWYWLEKGKRDRPACTRIAPQAAKSSTGKS